MRTFNRDFLLLWQGQLVSQLGNQAFSLAMIYWLMQATGSASLMGSLMMVSLLPGVLLGPVGGALADRHSRLRIIVISDVLRGFAVLCLAGTMFLRPEDPGVIIVGLFTVALFGGVVNAAFQPAVMAAIPDLVPPERVAAGNSLTQFSAQTSVLVGQAAGGLLYGLLGPATLFLIDGLTYLFSALSEVFIHLPRRRVPDRLPPKRILGTYTRDTLAGLRHVWNRPGMRSFLLVAGGVNFLAMPVIILLPFYVSERLLRGPAWYGFLLAALGAGSLIGYMLVGLFNVQAERRPGVLAVAFLAVGALLASIGFLRSPAAALGSLLLVGVCTGAINILVLTLFQVATPADMRGRVMALVIALSGAVTPLGMALGGVLGDATNKNLSAIYATCGILILTLVGIAFSRFSFREFLRWDPGDATGNDPADSDAVASAADAAQPGAR